MKETYEAIHWIHSKIEDDISVSLRKTLDSLDSCIFYHNCPKYTYDLSDEGYTLKEIKRLREKVYNLIYD